MWAVRETENRVWGLHLVCLCRLFPRPRLHWVQIKTFWCEVVSLGDSMLDVELDRFLAFWLSSIPASKQNCCCGGIHCWGRASSIHQRQQHQSRLFSSWGRTMQTNYWGLIRIELDIRSNKTWHCKCIPLHLQDKWQGEYFPLSELQIKFCDHRDYTKRNNPGTKGNKDRIFSWHETTLAWDAGVLRREDIFIFQLLLSAFICKNAKIETLVSALWQHFNALMDICNYYYYL